MLTDRQIRQNAQDRVVYVRLRCTKCGAMMKDCEPCSPSGEYWHPDNDCGNSGMRFSREPPSKNSVKKPVSGIEQVTSKKFMRARKRGAKLASKHR